MVNKKSLVILMGIITVIYFIIIAIVLLYFLYISQLVNPPGRVGPLWDLITSGVKLLIPGVSVLGWLYFWNLLIRMYFWRTVKTSNAGAEEEEEDTPEE